MPGKRLVVDACVARSAGISSEAPQSTHSREALVAIRQNVDHRLVFNTALRIEWLDHGSKLASTFFTYMTQKRRVDYVSDDSFAGVLRGCAHQFDVPEAKEAFVKDRHVVAAALMTDRTIISNEARLRAQLVQLADQNGVIAEIMWSNPVVEGNACVEWLLDGAEPSAERQIGPPVTRP
jgi:hypothetical protein